MASSFIQSHCSVGDFIVYHNISTDRNEVGLITSLDRSVLESSTNFQLSILPYPKYDRPDDNWDGLDDNIIYGVSEVYTNNNFPIATISSASLIDFAFVFTAFEIINEYSFGREHNNKICQRS